MNFGKHIPKKQNKAAAEKAFKKLNPDDELFNTMLEALEQQKHTPEWSKYNVKYVPLPSTWIRDRRWEDEINRVYSIIDEGVIML